MGDGAEPVYTLGSDPAELLRLRRQSDELRTHSASLLDRAEISPGQRALDLGCGPSGIVDLLAERVGPRGSVVGMDINEASVRLAREHVTQLGLVNVSVAVGDARATGLPAASFDLVHARTLLINIPKPDEVV